MTLEQAKEHIESLLSIGYKPDTPFTVLIEDVPCEIVDFYSYTGKYRSDPEPKLTPYIENTAHVLVAIPVGHYVENLK